ncbi:MAG: L-seryl-tRNA(Sec) selenium transferase [Betaproteobacteria bacterium]
MRLAAIPSVDRILQDSRLASAIGRHGRELVVAELRAELAARRAALKGGTGAALDEDAIVGALLARLDLAARPSLRPVFNLTGTVLHTNLGRAQLPAEAVEACARIQAGPANLEYDLEAGERGERDDHLEALLCRITGAEAATVVNNNAAAVLLALNALAAGREVPVSRGELVEIGGSFRIPDIIEAAGCTLREVGTTNRTHLRDFERAIGPNTAAILKVHTSNYAVVGFTAAPGEDELATLAHAKGLPFVTDLGSGSLVDLAHWGLPAEPTPMQALAAGADLVTFSGDKLLGGPQAGLVVGKRDLVERLRKNPLKRALRLDKGRIAALEAVLRLYLDPERLAERLPALRQLARSRADIAAAAERMKPLLQAWCGALAGVTVADCASQVGSGSLPVDRLPSAALRISSSQVRPAAVAKALRGLPVPVIARIHDDATWLDLRCLEDEAGFAASLSGRKLA